MQNPYSFRNYRVYTIILKHTKKKLVLNKFGQKARQQICFKKKKK